MSKFRILIVEDEPIIAETLALYIDNDDFETCAICYDYEEAIESLKLHSPDAALLDINLQEEKTGIQIAEYINKFQPIPFLYVTSYSDKDTLIKAKLTAPSGYIVKPFNKNTVCASLEIAISNYHTFKEFSLKLNSNKINKSIPTPLSERELEVLQQIIKGLSNSAIANELYLSINTIKTHIKNIHLKLDSKNRIELVNKIIELS